MSDDSFEPDSYSGNDVSSPVESPLKSVLVKESPKEIMECWKMGNENIPTIISTPQVSDFCKNCLTGRRRQKSLQFITTELIMLILNQKECYEDATLNPSEVALKLNITRRRVYDIIHVLCCIGLLRRLSYRLYEWLGFRSMQNLFTQLFNSPPELFEQHFYHCFQRIGYEFESEFDEGDGRYDYLIDIHFRYTYTNKKQTHLKHISTLNEKESKGESTTKHITIKFLKYIFNYIKTGRRTFNSHDITPFIVCELQSIQENKGVFKSKKDREKGIERRLYDIVSVLCGMGIIKRKVDSIEWNLTPRDCEANITNSIATYNKGNNMMVCIANYLEVDQIPFGTVAGMRQESELTIDQVWKQLQQLFNERQVITAIDIEYLRRCNSGNSISMNDGGELQIDIPAVPATSSQNPNMGVFWGIPKIDEISEIQIQGNYRTGIASNDVNNKRIKSEKAAKRGISRKRRNVDFGMNDEETEWNPRKKYRKENKSNQSKLTKNSNDQNNHVNSNPISSVATSKPPIEDSTNHVEEQIVPNTTHSTNPPIPPVNDIGLYADSETMWGVDMSLNAISSRLPFDLNGSLSTPVQYSTPVISQPESGFFLTSPMHGLSSPFRTATPGVNPSDTLSTSNFMMSPLMRDQSPAFRSPLMFLTSPLAYSRYNSPLSISLPHRMFGLSEGTLPTADSLIFDLATFLEVPATNSPSLPIIPALPSTVSEEKVEALSGRNKEMS